MRQFVRFLCTIAIVASATFAAAQHLWWQHDGLLNATCIYGEITVLATHPTTYYCGVDWQSQPMHGYCGIQHNSDAEKRTIFSEWDTSSARHAQTTYYDPETIHTRFGGEGEGAHTHMIWNWKLNETSQVYFRTHSGTARNSMDSDYFVYDRSLRAWRHSATIMSPDVEGKSPQTIAGGGVMSFLENFTNTDREVARIATYNLWLGAAPMDMHRLIDARGDGLWGELGDAYFMAEGTLENLAIAFEGLKERYGTPVYGPQSKPMTPLVARQIAPRIVRELSDL